MRKNIWTVCIVVLVAFALGACSGSDDKKPPSASKSAADLTIAEQKKVEVEEKWVLSLSPNGHWLIAYGKTDLCVYQTEPFSKKLCSPLETQSLDMGSIAWSPDSRRVAFTENSLKYYHESDLWIFEVESGKFVNLTDDGLNELDPGALDEDKPLIDLVPTWSPDGKDLVFARAFRANDNWNTTLYRISANGGEPKELLQVSGEEPAVVWYKPLWSGDGKRIFYTFISHESSHPDNGVWSVGRDGKNPEHILGITKEEIGAPFLLDISANGDKALIWYYRAFQMFNDRAGLCLFGILDLQSGSVECLKEAADDELESIGVTNATFSPDGSKVLYVCVDLDRRHHLIVRDLKGSGERVLLTTEDYMGTFAEFGLGLDWAQDDTIFAAILHQQALLLKLSDE